MNTQLVTVSNVIRRQIGISSLMTLGAHDLRTIVENDREIGLQFTARILPFTRFGLGPRGERPRLMTVRISLNSLNFYELSVTYSNRGSIYTHYSANSIDAETLRSTLLALDFDGETVLNPRYA